MRYSCGIYKISLRGTEKCYIGSSGTIEYRWETHRVDLRAGTHMNRYLQNLWNKYGEESFEFSIIEYCPREDLLRVEQGWIDSIPLENRINLNPVAGKPPSHLGRRQSEEHIQKRANSTRGRTRSDEVKQKMSQSHLGRVQSEEERRKKSESAKRRWARQKNSDSSG